MAPDSDRYSPQEPISIPSTVAEHVLGESVSLLGEGDLTLIQMEASVAQPSARKPVMILALAVGKAAFPLYSDTVFGTLAGDERAYVFAPDMGEERKGYVKITLPSGVLEEGSPLAELQERFERVLIATGILKEGLEAAADEIGNSVREDGVRIAQGIRAKTQGYLAENPPTDAPVPVPSTMQSAAVSSASGTGGLASAVSRVTSAVSSAAGSAGAWVAGNLSTTESFKPLAYSYDAAADGLSAASFELRGSLSEGAGDVVENAWGKEVRGVAGNAGQSAGNVGKAIGNVAVATSGAGLATAGLKGAAGAQSRQQEDKITSQAGELEAEDMQAAHESDQDIADAEGWKDVSI